VNGRTLSVRETAHSHLALTSRSSARAGDLRKVGRARPGELEVAERVFNEAPLECGET
jgi:hypothetical protein